MSQAGSISKPSIRNVMTLSRYQWAAIIIFVVSSLFFTSIARVERSPWISMTLAIEPNLFDNPMLGYTLILDGKLNHRENISFIEQTMMFNGPFKLDYYFTRSVYGFVVANLAPFVGIIPAAILLNYLCWLAATVISWRFSMKLFEDQRVALLATTFTALGMGMINHIGDYSNHLMVFTLYYLSILIIYESRVWAERRPFRVHLFLGVYLAIICLTYNTGIMLTVGYLAVSFRYNRWYHLVAAAIIALTATSLWWLFLRLLNDMAGITPWIDPYSTDRFIFTQAINYWLKQFQHSIIGGIIIVLRRASDFFFFEAPPVVLLGLLSFFTLPKSFSLRWFFAVFFLVPVGASLVFTPSTTVRGYLIYGTTLLFYSALSAMFIKGLERKSIRWLAAVLLVLVLGFQILWNTAFLMGNYGPIKTYMQGFDTGRYLLNGLPPIVSLTGNEPTPMIMGGSAPLSQAGLNLNSPPVPVETQIPFALFSRSFYFVYIILFLIVASKTKMRRAVRNSLLIVFCYWAFSVFASSAFLKEKPTIIQYTSSINLPPGGQLSYTVKLSQQFIQLLQEKTAPDDRIVLYFPFDAKGDNSQHLIPIELTVGSETVALTQVEFHAVMWLIEPSQFLSTLQQNNEVTVTVNPVKVETAIGGWQAQTLSDRILKLVGAQERYQVFPLMEIRLIDKNGTLKLAGF
jgi:hypothetical protein